MNVSGNFIVFVHEYSYPLGGVYVKANNFSTTISNKDKDGNFQNAYLEMKFSKDIIEEYELNDNEEGDCLDVDVTEGFLSFRSYENKEGQTVIVYQIVVTAVNDICEHVKAEKKPSKPTKKANGKKSLKK